MNEKRETIVEANGVGKVYWDGNRRLQVLKDITLNVREGESVAVLGPSGSGKTTLLNILSGLDRPTVGDVKLTGIAIHHLSDAQRALLTNRMIGFVFQFYHLLPEFTALENVMLPAMIRGGVEDAPERAMLLLDRVGLKDRATHYPSELSGGEQQRVAIARSLVNDPKILFCDEPTGNLDQKTGETIADLLKDFLRKERKTLLMVTHDLRLAGMADHIWNLRTGKWDK